MNQLLLLSVHIRRVYIQLHQPAEPLRVVEDIKDGKLISPSAPAASVGQHSRYGSQTHSGFSVWV